MTPLEAEIRAEIAAEGPIGVDRYMQLCLQHPLHGYYTTRESIGRAGDFITAPEVDQMFGELLGLWAAQVWVDAGSPDGWGLAELGPGRGTLMADALRATKIVPGFHAAISVHLVETSPLLRSAQRCKLVGSGPVVHWHQVIEELPDRPLLVLANEFFDALPVRHYVRSPRGWHERQIGLGDQGHLVFGAARDTVAADLPPAAPGQVLEVGHGALRVLSTLAARVATRGGAVLICDYGHERSSLGETLQAVSGHRHAGVLDRPGEADLTAHVDFAGLARAALATGAVPYGPLQQGSFLRQLGIAERATALRGRATPPQAEALDAALDRFCSPQSSMATLFKVLAVLPPGTPPPPGFEDLP